MIFVQASPSGSKWHASFVAFVVLGVWSGWPGMQQTSAQESTQVLTTQERIVFVGSGLVERAAAWGYWECALRTAVPQARWVVRNLGWSGDTVFGHARAQFGTPQDGYRRLLEQVEQVQPTLIFTVYGQGESFDGPEHLELFAQGAKRLLEDLSQRAPKVVVILPPPVRPVPEGPQVQKWQKLYMARLARVARKHGHLVLNWFDAPWVGQATSQRWPWRRWGTQLTPLGYWLTAAALTQQLGLKHRPWEVHLALQSAQVRVLKAVGTQVNQVHRTATGLSWRCLDEQLPPPPAPWGWPQQTRWPHYWRKLVVQGLPKGTWELLAGGKPVARASAQQWAKGMLLWQGPPWDQVEQLRRTIVEKNQWYFHRWRPQNTTYLFGFRKHEQGHNAREVPQFDRWVRQTEEQIHRLQKPRPVVYQLRLLTNPSR